jgi:hypothetical protein
MSILDAPPQRRPIYSQVEASGDSFTFGSGGSDGIGMTERTAGLLGGLPVTNRAVGGAVASWSQSAPAGGGVGDGGYVKVANDLGRRATSTGGAPYLSKSSLVLNHYGFNDCFVATASGDGTAQQALPALTHAHRRIISNYLAVQLHGITDPSWTLGSGWAYQGASLYALEGACIANANATASPLTIAVPADFPGGTVAVAGFAFNGDVGTASFKVDGGTAQTLNLATIPSPLAGKATGWVKRLTGLAPGAHTIAISGTGIAGQFGLAVDTWWIEAPEPPTVLVVGCPKFHSSIGAPYITASGQGYRSVATLNAAMDALNAALVSLAAEFGPTVRFVDIDTSFGRQAVMFSSEDKLHPSDLGHATIAAACHAEALKVPASTSVARAALITPTGPRPMRQLRVQDPVTTNNAVLAVNGNTPVDASAGALSVLLPASAKEGSSLSVFKSDSSGNTVTITGSIRGVAAQSLTLPSRNLQVLLHADRNGSWWPIGSSGITVDIPDATSSVKGKTTLGAAGGAATFQRAEDIAAQVALLQPDGNIIYGTGAPASGTGKNGDSYVDQAASPPRLYGPKASGAWPGSFVQLGGTAVPDANATTKGIAKLGATGGAATFEAAQAAQNAADGKYTKPAAGIPTGDLADGAVTIGKLSFDPATQAELDAVASLPPKIPPWATGLTYAQYQAVTRGQGTYIAQTAHTSGGIFEDDLSAGKWALLPVAATVADATRIAKGGVQLSLEGDLGPLPSSAARPKVRRAGKRRPRLVFTHPSTPTIPATTLPGIPTVPYAPVILRAAGRLPNPIDNYYMYTSTDHDATAGGIWLLTAPTPLGPWTMQNGGAAIYVDAVQGNQTEVPAIEWDPLTEQVFLYYSNAATGSNQATQLATSVDGVTFERYGTIIATADLTNQPGNGHTGYFDATRLSDRLWIGTALRGGGGTSLQQLLWSRDGIAWVPDPQPLLNYANVTADNAWKVSQLRYFVVNGEVWAGSREQQTGVSGASKSDGVLVAGPVTADFRAYDGPPEVVSTRVEATQVTEGEPKFFVDDDGTLYMSYVNGASINVAYAEVNL